MKKVSRRTIVKAISVLSSMLPTTAMGFFNVGSLFKSKSLSEHTPHPNFSNVKLLLRFNEPIATTTTTDLSGTGQVWDMLNGSAVTTSFARYTSGSYQGIGGTSFLCDYGVDHSNLNLAADFCIELSVRFGNTDTDQALLSMGNSNVVWWKASDNKIKFSLDNCVTTIMESTTAVLADQFYDLALCRSSGVMSLYLNGNLRTQLQTVQ
jgi:hypothetical protein